MSKSLSVPFVDLVPQNEIVRDQIFQGWSHLLAESDFVLGEQVRHFEEEFASYCGLSECVGVGNGGDAVEFSLRVLGVKSGDEVIIPANTFIATATAIVRIGAIPILVDVNMATQLIDPINIIEKINERTKAVIAVHLFGQMAPMKQLWSICQKHGISLIEDAAQAQGATQDGLSLGAYSDLVATSFYPGKNLGAYGDAGAILTNNRELAHQLREMRNYGGTVKYVHNSMGYNSRLDNLQAVVLNAKLAHLNQWNEQRNKIAMAYLESFANVGNITMPVVATGNLHVWHLFVVQVSNREQMIEHLTRHNVGFGIHYPTPIHLHEAFTFLGAKLGDFPTAEKLSATILSLPMYPGMTNSQIEYVAETVKSFEI